MTEPLSQEQQRLNRVRDATMARIVSFMNGVGLPVKNQYPIIEVDSWPIQAPEAERVVSSGEAAVLAMSEAQMKEIAPFLCMVCDAHHGAAADDAERAERLWTKSLAVKANSDAWLPISAYLGGTRAKAAQLLSDANSDVAFDEIESTIAGEIGLFRAQFPFPV